MFRDDKVRESAGGLSRPLQELVHNLGLGSMFRGSIFAENLEGTMDVLE